MNKNIFAKTLIPNIKQSITENFGDKDFDAIYEDACAILEYEIAHCNNRGNKAVGKHLCINILPGFACYQALLNVGVSNKKVVAFITEELSKSSQRMGNLCGKLSHKSYAYPVVKMLFGFGMKFGYPKEGWTVEKIENNKDRIRLNMKSCLYCEELDKRSALELCPAFCQTDHTIYDPLSPAVVFKRENTIAKGATHCDFCFERGRLNAYKMNG